MGQVAQEALVILKEMFPKGAGLHEPRFEGNEWKYLKDCLDSGWVSSVGAYVDRFEKDLADYTGAKRAIVVANGTVALQVSLLLAGLDRGDEVLVPALSFVATANAVSHAGGIPHFVDAEEISLGVDAVKLARYLDGALELKSGTSVNRKTGKRVRALIPMHTFGHPCDLDALLEICEKYHLTLVEDAAESLGSHYKGKHTGVLGRLASLSFNGNKTITTGGGGAILTSDEELGKRAKHLTTTAKLPHAWEFIHDEVGYNFRMPNLNAALGCAQLEKLPAFLSRKRELAERYMKAFSSATFGKILREPAYARSNYWLNTLVLNPESATNRDGILKALHESKILARPAWRLLNRLPMYEGCPRMDLSCAESLERRIVSLPSSVFL